MTAGFLREVEENCTLLGYYATGIAKLFNDFSGKIIGPIFTGQESFNGRNQEGSLYLEVGTDMLSQSVGKGLPLPAVY